MRVVNPIGRKVESKMAANNLARACFCTTDSSFYTGKGTDSCSHCGCSCAGRQDVSGYNTMRAQVTYRKSKL